MHFPAWRGVDISALPTISIGAWASHVGLALSKSSSRADRGAGIVAIDANVPLLTSTELDAIPMELWQRDKSDFVYATWLAHVAAAAAQGADSASTSGEGSFH